MDFSKVKLIVSDMDGTLLDPQGDISHRFFNQFKELKKHNIHFVAASGRQYQSILDKLTPIRNEISIIAENGGLMQFNNSEQVLFRLSKEDVVNSINILRCIKDCYIVLCGRKSAYIETENVDFVSKFSKHYAVYSIVNDLTKVIDDVFLKIAVYHFESSEDYVLPQLNQITKDLKVVVSGQNWLDISHPNVDKSYALSLIQKDLKITEKETMVFGDYKNDLQMLKLGHYSYAMKNAHPEVKQIASFETKSNYEEGVEVVLDAVLKSKML